MLKVKKSMYDEYEKCGINKRQDLAFINPKNAGYQPWKFGFGKNVHVIMFMNKFGILTTEDFTFSAEHFLKFALTKGLDGEQYLAFLLKRIRYFSEKDEIELKTK